MGEHITYPWTRIADVEVVAALLGREPGARLGGDPVPERAVRPLEVAGVVCDLLVLIIHHLTSVTLCSTSYNVLLMCYLGGEKGGGDLDSPFMMYEAKYP